MGARPGSAWRQEGTTLALGRVYRRIRYGDPIIVVSGLPRSGTSMLMKMLQAGGLEAVIDGVRTADEDNPRGYFEDERVKNLAREPDKSWLDSARGKAIKIVTYLLKELPPCHNYKVLLMKRDLREVIASQNKMLVRRGEQAQTGDERTRELLEKDFWQAGYLIAHRPHFNTMEIHYRNVIEHPVGEARRIAEFVGASLDAAAMAGVVDRQLYRNRAEPATD